MTAAEVAAGGTETTVVRPVRVPADAGLGFTLVVQAHPYLSSMRPLEFALEQAADGDCVAYAVAVDTPLFTRLMTLATFRLQRRRAERTIARAGGRVVASYGVDPSLTHPACFYELDSPAAEYADRCVRPRGPSPGLRRMATRCFGCDPASGGVLVVGRKSCS